MARKAAGDDSNDSSSHAPNVIDLARARTQSHARRAASRRWPVDGPHPERIAAAALEATDRDAALVARDGTVLTVNRRWLLAAPGCLPGTDVLSAWRLNELDPRDGAQVLSGIRSALTGTLPFQHDYRLPGDERSAFHRLVVHPLGGEAGGAVVTVELRTTGSEDDQPDLGRDPLTGLANRTRFLDELSGALSVRTPGRFVAVLVVDLHDFKLVNQAYGHAIGDQLLVEVGRRLVEVARPDDHVAHLGGDEFAVLRRAARGSGDAASLAAEVAERLAAPFRAGTRQVHLSTGVGCRVADPALHDSAVEVLRDAVAAMRDARDHGPAGGPAGNGVSFFSEATRARVLRRMALESDLRVAVEEEQLRVAFQPQVDLRTGKVHGAEALVRWRHPEHGDVPPSEFVPIAEATGLIAKLGEWVLAEACRELAGWKAEGSAPAFVTVNLSPLQLTDGALVPLVARLLEEHGLRPDELCMELTESALMASPEHGIDSLRALRALGTSVALDDFGTGYSSLGMLKQLPVDVLKLDRAFVAGLGADEQDRAIVTAIMALAAALGLKTVAEGVEEHDQAERLLRLGCEVVQGWLYAPAVAPDELPALCRDGFDAVPTPQITHPGADQAPMQPHQEDRSA
jgi:diguanylate cyclase (GGDEF)-like protein